MANVKENFEEDSLQQLGHVVQVRCSVAVTRSGIGVALLSRSFAA